MLALCLTAPPLPSARRVQKALKFVRMNFDHLEYVEKTPAAATMATFIKKSDDTRGEKDAR